jgi:hypothetical protein
VASVARRIPLLAAVAAVAALPCASAGAQRTVIASGVTAGGVPLGGLTVPQATSRLESRLGAFVMRATVVHAAGRTLRLDGGRAGVVLDAAGTAQRAALARDGEPIALGLTHSQDAVARFSRTVSRAVTRHSRSARLRITVRHMLVRRARHGHTISAGALAARVDAVLARPRLRRVLRVRVTSLRPRVTVEALRRRYPTYVTIDRANFTLRLFKRLRLSKRYGIAVGMAGLATPPGHYRIREKQVDPTWHVPNRAWAGSLAGQTIPGGAPDNPLKARWLGIANGVGIHGTAEDWSIGSRASHGCIRMHVADVIDLYPRVPVGTPVLIR